MQGSAQSQPVRRSPLIALSPDAVARMLAPVFAHPAVRSIMPITQGAGNTNYLVRRGRQPFELVLRLCPSEQQCRKEMHLQRWLSAKIPVPRLYHEHPLPDAEGTRIAYGMQFVPGRTLAEALREDGPACYQAYDKEIAALLSTLQGMAFQAHGDLAGEPADDTAPKVTPWHFAGNTAYDGVMQEFLHHPAVAKMLGAERVAAIRACLAQQAALIESMHENACLAHGDFNPTNLICSAAGQPPQIFALIDWEWAHAGVPLMDLANMMRSRTAVSNAFQQALVHACDKTFGLPPDWQTRLDLLDLSSQLEFLTFADQASGFANIVLARVDALLSGKLLRTA